jgi:hypothetical protein
MHQVFFFPSRAQHIVIILEIHVFPLEQIPCVKPTMQQKPEEEFVPSMNKGFPHPLKDG